MELLVPNLYTNYAHTPEKIRGGMSTALEIAKQNSQDLVVLYEPLTNRRQHFIKDEYKDVFAGAKKLYWVPTYLAREDPDLPLLTPAELITCISDPSIASPAELNDELLQHIRNHLQNGDLVVAMGAAGGRSMDEWLRNRFVVQ
jgi:UDP-N-acetylmuramate-alanine ligase